MIAGTKNRFYGRQVAARAIYGSMRMEKKREIKLTLQPMRNTGAGAAGQIVRNTLSVCPVCMKRLPASVVRRGSAYFLEKSCPEHGSYSVVVWRGKHPTYEDWGAGYTPPAEEQDNLPGCPGNCGLCPGHRQKTCCALVEVTRRCDLRCPVCFAGAGGDDPDPPVGKLYEQFKRLVKNGDTFIQLSGGEPTVRDDLAEIVAAAKLAGCENIQLNTNGVRLGTDRALAGSLREAGLSFVFMQFDGTKDEIYNKLRGKPLLGEKTDAIKNCAGALLGVTLVPTLAPGVNVSNIGEIIDFGLSNSPAVRGVHFQPISYFGRYPRAPENRDRITLPEVLRAIEVQTGGKFGIPDFVPSRCDHPYCGFHGDFAVLPHKRIMKLTPKEAVGCCEGEAHLKNRNFVSRRWKRSAESEADCCGSDDPTEMGAFVTRIKSNGFTVTAMAFQDVYNLDIERLRRCSLHVSEGGNLTPFCAKYITAADGEGL